MESHRLIKLQQIINRLTALVTKLMKIQFVCAFSVSQIVFFSFMYRRFWEDRMKFGSHSVDELLPRLVLIAEVIRVNGQVEELPLALRLQHLVGELRGPGRVGGGNEAEFTD